MTKYKFLAFMVLICFCAHAESALQKEYLDAVGKIDKAVAEQDWPKAEQLTLEALRLDPANESNWMLISNLGMIQYYQGKDSLALATLNDGVIIRPTSKTMLGNRARILAETGNIDAALKDYDTILQLDSLYTPAYLKRGILQLFYGKLSRAEADIQKALSLAPEQPDSWVAAATLYTVMGRPDKAIEFYNKLINLNPTAEYYAARAFALLELDLLQDASDDIAAGMELDDNYSELYLCRAILNKRRYENDRALSDAQRAIDLGADSKRVRETLGF